MHYSLQINTYPRRAVKPHIEFKIKTRYLCSQSVYSIYQRLKIAIRDSNSNKGFVRSVSLPTATKCVNFQCCMFYLWADTITQAAEIHFGAQLNADVLINRSPEPFKEFQGELHHLRSHRARVGRTL